MTHQPVLSILIPAYEYSFGVKRILDSIYQTINLDPKVSLECIVSDDSSTEEVMIMIQGHDIYRHESFKYFRRDKSQGAADNWNFLLNIASGKYIHFMHHDEFPESFNFFGNLVNDLEGESSFDVLFLRCYVSTFINNRFRPLVSSIIRKIYFLSPEALFLRNTVGSPSCIVIKRERVLKFDRRLRWIVDLEWYYRILKQEFIITKFSKLSYISVHRKESISSEIKSKVDDINNFERQLIKNDYAAKFLDLRKDSSKLWYKIFMLLEGMFWYGSKFIYYPLGVIFGKTVKSSLIEESKYDHK